MITPFTSRLSLYIFRCWLAAGMANDAATLARVQRSGMGVLQPAMGMQALAALLGARSPAVFSAAPVHWVVLLRSAKPPPPFFADFAPAAQTARALPGKPLGSQQLQVRQAPPEPVWVMLPLHTHVPCCAGQPFV